MHTYAIRWGLALAMLVMSGIALWGQGGAKPSATISTLPPAQPTGVAGQTANAVPPVAPQRYLRVNYSGGNLAVEASNVGLNEILREISHKIGMKITGGVADDRVFGNYGPAAPSAVLSALLDGTESNFLLVDGVSHGVGEETGRTFELILTPRNGRATPPNPSDSASEADQGTGAAQYVAPIRPFQAPVASSRVPGLMPNMDGAPAKNAAAGDQSDPNATKTPQQIYDQLQRVMQQQKQGTTAPPQ